MARDLRDLELALSLIAGPDGHDSDVPPVPLDSPPRRPLEDLHLAVAPTPPGATVAKSIRRQVERVAAQASDAGAHVEERYPDLDWDVVDALFGELVETIVGVFDPQAQLPEERRTLAWYLGALDRRDRFIAAWEEFLEDFDGLILPPAITTAFTHREPGAPLEVDGKTLDYRELARVPSRQNMTGLPGLTVPAGVDDDGLPIGIEIVGPRWSELRLLRIARALEQAEILPGFQRPKS